jgi:hypothetical protein
LRQRFDGHEIDDMANAELTAFQVSFRYAYHQLVGRT